MPFTYKYKSGETFSYKWWHVTVENLFGGITRINFAVDGTKIWYACEEAAKKSGIINDIRIKSILSSSFYETALGFLPKNVDSISVHHMGFNYWKKCKEDAISHIDNVLGDGLSYAKKNNLYPSLNIFF